MIKVTMAKDVTDPVIPNGGATATQPEDHPDTAKLRAQGWTVIRRWEVTRGPNGFITQELKI